MMVEKKCCILYLKKMEWNIEHNAEQDILVVTYTGAFTEDETKEVAKKVFDTAYEQNCKRILFDHLKAAPLFSLTDIFERASQLDRLNIRPGTQLAFVHEGPTRLYNLTEVVLSFRGYNMRVFEDYDEAIAWLKADKVE